MLVRACRSLGGFEPDVRHFIDDVRLILGLVEATRAVALVPLMGWSGQMPGVVVRPVAGVELDRRIFTAVRAGTGERPAQVAVRAALAEQARALGLKTT